MSEGLHTFCTLCCLYVLIMLVATLVKCVVCLVEFVILHVFISSLCCFFNFYFSSFVDIFF